MHVGTLLDSLPFTLWAPVSNRPSLISHSILPMVLFRRSLHARLVANPPWLSHWIGTHSKLHLASPIIVWPFEEVQDILSCRSPHIPLTIPLCTIWERIQIYGRTTHIPGQSTNMATTTVQRFSEPWRPPKIRTCLQKEIVGRTSGTRNI